MKISDLVKSGAIEPGQLLRDGEFSSIGFLTHATIDKLCFIQSENTLELFSDFAGVSCVVTTPELSEMISGKYPWGVVVSESPSITFYDINNHFCDRGIFFHNTKFKTSIHPSAKIYPEAIVYDQGVVIGPDCLIEPGAIICPGAILGTGVVIRCGSVISSEGYQYYYGKNGKRTQVKHGGLCIINSDVEIKPNSIIDRGVLSVSTEIGSGTKIDAKVHFGHNVKCGVDCMIVGGTTISGNVTIGDCVWIGPGSTISSNIDIGNHAYIALGSVVTRNILPGEKVSGNFAISHDKNIQHLKGIR